MLIDIKHICNNRIYNKYIWECNDSSTSEFSFEVPYYDWKLGAWEKETFTLN